MLIIDRLRINHGPIRRTQQRNRDQALEAPLLPPLTMAMVNTVPSFIIPAHYTLFYVFFIV